MGLFGGTPKVEKIIEKYKKGKTGIEDFAKQMTDITVYSASPVGEDKDGNRQLYLLPDKDGVLCQPVFTTKEKGEKYFASVGRVNCQLLEGPLIVVVRTMRRMNEKHNNKAFGIIVDPLEADIWIPNEVIETMK